MKNDSIQHLLAKRQAGTLTDSELQELNRLTRKDEVVAAAEQAAVGIVRRRRLTVSAVALVAVVVGTVGITMLMPRHEAPMVAQQQPIVTPTVTEPSVIPTEPTESLASITPAKAVAKKRDNTAAKPVRTTVKPASAAEPVVVCNNQCEADSVINDIWKFLSA